MNSPSLEGWDIATSDLSQENDSLLNIMLRGNNEKHDDIVSVRGAFFYES